MASGIGWCDYQYHAVRKEGYHLPQINMCTGGKGVLSVGGREYEITENMSFYLPPAVPHEYYTSGSRWDIKWVTFGGRGCDILLEQLGLTEACVFTHTDMTAVNKAWQQIYRALKENNEASLEYGGVYLYRYLTEYMLSVKRSDSTASGAGAYQKACSYIEEHFTEDISIDELSAAAGVSPQYLCRIFKKRVAMRPFQYIACRRIQYAKQLLIKGIYSVGEVSQMCGYNDVSYFCRIFREHEGISPGSFMPSEHQNR